MFFLHDRRLSGDGNAPAHEHGRHVTRPERPHLFQYFVGFPGNIFQIEFLIHANHRRKLLGQNAPAHDLVEAQPEGVDVLDGQSHARCEGVAAKLFEQVGAFFDGLIHVEARYRPRRTGRFAVGFGQNNCRPMKMLDAATRYDADDALMPVFFEKHRTLGPRKPGVFLNHGQSLIGNTHVEFPAIGIVLVDLLREFVGLILIVAKQQPHGFFGVFDAPGGVDAWAEAEDDILNIEHIMNARNFDQSLQPGAGGGIQVS